MTFWSSPTSYRLARAAVDSPDFAAMHSSQVSFAQHPAGDLYRMAGNSQHPDFPHLILLVFEAVLEVVCVSMPGYIIARLGMFGAEQQKFLANLNVMLFTPCLIFTKLASQLNASKLIELAIIPAIFALQICVSLSCAFILSKLFGFRKRGRNFVTAMAVFGNSNSLPISLVISLSKTLSGLHWDKVPGDNDNEVAARGILYLLIFQQLGQLVRWSWGYHVLLAPPESYPDEDEVDGHNRLEAGRYTDASFNSSRENLIDGMSDDSDSEDPSPSASRKNLLRAPPDSDYGSGSGLTNTPRADSPSPLSSRSSSTRGRPDGTVYPTPTNGNLAAAGFTKVTKRLGPTRGDSQYITVFPQPASSFPLKDNLPSGLKGHYVRAKASVGRVRMRTVNAAHSTAGKAFSSLPQPVQTGLRTLYVAIGRFLRGLWEFMNPPLWAMLCAVLVASIPKLQHLFFDKGTFIENSVTRAVAQSGGVAVPLILVVLGANLARNTLPREERGASDDPKLERNLLIASLLCRMLLPILCMAPILALMAKFVPVSILDDPIFVIVCFLLTGAPSALQLAQICQLNNVYMGAMSKLLFQSYVIWILPSTLILVMLALETVEWAQS